MTQEVRQMSKAPKAWVFDAYGTIFDVHSVVDTAEKLFPGQGKALSLQWRTRQLEYSWLRSLMQRHVDFEQLTRDSLIVTCAAMGLPASAGDIDTLVGVYRRLTPYADALAALPG